VYDFSALLNFAINERGDGGRVEEGEGKGAADIARASGGAIDDPLVEDIRNVPDADDARLVWADVVGGERGELVVLQIDLERGGLSARDAILRRRRQRQLLARHGATWSGLAGLAHRVSFRRGFVDAIAVPAAVWLAHAPEILDVAPALTSVTLTALRADGPSSDPMPLLSRALAHPATRTLRGFAVGCETTALVGDRTPGDIAIDMIARSGLLPQLRALGSLDALGAPGTISLASARALHGLERLWLPEQHDADSLQMLLATGLPALRSLDLGRRCAAAAAPATVTELAAMSLDGASLPALEVLDALAATPAALAALPKLRMLWLHQPTLARLPALRELACRSGIGVDTARAFADTLGPQLELLDVRNSHAALRHVNALKPRVAGELLVGELPRAHRGLLRVGPTSQMPWWDHVTLE
jgi:hypothetical protein